MQKKIEIEQRICPLCHNENIVTQIYLDDKLYKKLRESYVENMHVVDIIVKLINDKTREKLHEKTIKTRKR